MILDDKIENNGNGVRPYDRTPSGCSYTCGQVSLEHIPPTHTQHQADTWGSTKGAVVVVVVVVVVPGYNFFYYESQSQF